MRSWPSLVSTSLCTSSRRRSSVLNSRVFHTPLCCCCGCSNFEAVPYCFHPGLSQCFLEVSIQPRSSERATNLVLKQGAFQSAPDHKECLYCLNWALLPPSPANCHVVPLPKLVCLRLFQPNCKPLWWFCIVHRDVVLAQSQMTQWQGQ